MRPTVLLFDIDGTLVTTGGVGRRALKLAFQELYGRDDACTFRLDGMTDRLIARQGLSAIHVEPTEEAIDQLLATYVRILEVQVLEADLSRYQVHHGIREALNAAKLAGCALGLGTGNIRDGARIKLERVALFEHFAFGGFGCDAENRTELIRIGAERGAAALGKSRAECRVVIIGDTPKDVAAAQAIGAECVGVGTGSFSPEDLLAVGATAAFRDLRDDGALDALLSVR
jgi:phosphoglycolate phosphatase-like HAD superfamily hydrolase